MVFVGLFGFFAILFELRRRVIWFIRPCARFFGITSSLRLAQPHRQRHHLIPAYFVYSSNSRRWHLLPRLLRLRLPWRPSLLVPLGDGIWLCILPCTFGIGNTGVCPYCSRCIPEPGKFGHVSPDGLTASTTTSVPLRLPRRVAIFVSGVFSITPPPWRLLVRLRLHVWLPRLRQPRQLYVDHGYSTHGIFDHGSSSSATSTSAQRATIRMSYSPVFSLVAASAPHRCYDCGGMLVSCFRLLLQSHHLRCSRCDCGGVLEYIW